MSSIKNTVHTHYYSCTAVFLQGILLNIYASCQAYSICRRMLAGILLLYSQPACLFFFVVALLIHILVALVFGKIINLLFANKQQIDVSLKK